MSGAGLYRVGWLLFGQQYVLIRDGGVIAEFPTRREARQYLADHPDVSGPDELRDSHDVTSGAVGPLTREDS